MSVFVVEDIKARTRHGKGRWNAAFSPLQVGKHWFYEELGKLAAVQTMQGYETQELREQLDEEDGEEAGRGLGCALRRCMGVGLQCGRRAQVAGQYALGVHHAFHLAPSATAPLPAREEWQA